VSSREIDVRFKLASIIRELVNEHRFNGFELDFKVEFKIDGKYVDIAVLLKPQEIPILIIETKGDIDPFDETVIGQALCYATLAKRQYGLPVTPFFATANLNKLVLFQPIERPEELVDINKCEKRDYENALKPGAYSSVRVNKVVDIVNTLMKEDIQKVLEHVADTWTSIVATYRPEILDEELRKFRLPPSRSFIEQLRSQFIDYLSNYFINDHIRYKLINDNSYYQELDRLAREAGYKNGLADIIGSDFSSVDRLARMMLYVLLNKIIFYKVLERHYKLPKLEPLLPRVRGSTEYLNELNLYFEKAIEVTQDFEAIFKTGLFDKIVLPDDVRCLKTVDSIIKLLDEIEVERLSDIIGHIYEQLIPPEERHQMGQFYTPPPIAELIVKWSIRTPDDKVLDPGCGSGTFLIEAYKRLFELKTGRKYGEFYPSEELHEKILSQLYAFDINPFAAQLTAMNLSMMNTKVPSKNVNVVVTDYFAVVPGMKMPTPYMIKTSKGEMRGEIEIPNEFDCVVGNPPYTRWTEVPTETQNRIYGNLGSELSKYGLAPKGRIGKEVGIYVYWIMHSTKFLREGGRLGMIISDSWLQTEYGKKFFKYLYKNYKIHAIIDISARVFQVPLIGTCIVLLEKCSNRNERANNRVVFAYLDISKGDLEVDHVLKLITEIRNQKSYNSDSSEFSSGAKRFIKVYKQRHLYKYKGNVIGLIFGADDILRRIEKHQLMTGLATYFEPSRGNTVWSYWKLKHKIGPDVGGNEFFYLTEEGRRAYNIPDEFLYPLLSKADHTMFFVFTRSDWEKIRDEGNECYLFLAHKPKSELPEAVRRYIELGEKDADQGGIVLTKGRNKGKAVAKSVASQIREKHRDYFSGWYDLGDVLTTPFFVPYYADSIHRFTLVEPGFSVALDADFIAFIPKPGVNFDIIELKALLAYLNSSFIQLYIELRGRVPGGVGPSGLEVSHARDMPILNVKKLPKEVVETLAKLFDKLEEEARNLGSAIEVENVFGSELARELGYKKIKSNIQGLFNSAIKEIDYEVAKILNLEDVVDYARAVLLDLVKRRLARKRDKKSAKKD